jgi:hypothetical protein
MMTPERARQPQQRKPLAVGRDLWWHVGETCAIVTVAVLAAAWLIPVRVPLWEMSGVMAVISGVIWWVTVRITGSLGLAGWLLGWGVTLTAWFTTARLVGVWSSEILTALVLAFVILTPFGPAAIANYRAMGRLEAAARERDRGDAEKRKWETMFTRLGVRNMRITAIYRHPTGLQVAGQLGSATDKDGVVTFERIKALAPQVAVDRKLPPGAVYFEEGETADLFTMHLRTLIGKRPVEFLPDYREPATINKPLGVGKHDNGQEFKALFREVAVMIVGVRDSGKSNLMSVLIAQIARCPDALIFVIDLKGGRMARPWLVPWLLGKSPRPVIDWLATTREEAVIMLDALIAAGQARAEDGEGGEKITPSRANPAVFLFVDETAIMTGHGIRENNISNSKIATKLAVIAETFRSEAIDPVVAALRSNVDIMGSTALKAQSTLRFGLRVNEPQDGQSVFPNDEAAAKALSKITEQGAGMARVGSRITPPIQFYRITLERCIRIAQLTGAWRPAPDQVLLDAFGEAYEGRWDRMEERLGKWRAKAERGDYGGEELEEGRPRAAVALLDRPPQDRDPALGGGGPGGGELPGWDPAADTDDEFWRVVGQEQDPEGKIHPARRAMREILIRAGDDGVKAGELYNLMKGQGHRVHRTTLYEWLAKEAELGRVSRYGRGKNDPNARWVWVRQVNGPARRDDQEDW